jgi:peptide/nickel transport system permease protein
LSEPSPVQQPRKRKSASQWAVAWRRFKRNKAALAGLVMVGTLFLVAALSDFLAPYPARPDPRALTPLYEGDSSKPPSWKYPFGTAAVGYDIYSEVIHGTRYTIYVGVMVSVITMAIAIMVGSVAGYYGKIVDNVLMRVAEVFLVFPSLLLILAFVRVFQIAAGAGFWILPVLGIRIPVGLTIVVFVLSVFGWSGNARLVRGEFLRLREMEFVQAAKALGASNRRIIFRHILPNTLSAVIVVSTLTIAYAILLEASVSFLGFGDPNTITWGQLLQEGFTDVRLLWWGEVFPGLAVLFSVFGFNLLGDGLADALNPRLRE